MVEFVPLGELATIYQGLITSGRGEGARPGPLRVKIATVGDIQDDILSLVRSETRNLRLTEKTERQLLQPYDVLVSARSTLVKAALVPISFHGLIADSTLLVVRGREPVFGPYLWWFLTSDFGRQQLKARATGSVLLSLSPPALKDLQVPLPPLEQQHRIYDLVRYSEQAYEKAIEAANLRRTLFRDQIIQELLRTAEDAGERERE